VLPRALYPSSGGAPYVLVELRFNGSHKLQAPGAHTEPAYPSKFHASKRWRGWGVRPVVMRSTRPSTLNYERRDLVRCARDFDIVLAAPPSERFIVQYYIDEGSLGKLSTSGGKLFAIDNPINKMALADIAGSVILDGGIPLVDALAAFLCSKRKISICLRDQLGECVYVSPSLEALEFYHVAIFRKGYGSNISD